LITLLLSSLESSLPEKIKDDNSYVIICIFVLGFDVLCFALFEHYFVWFWVSCGVTRLLIEMFDKIVDMQEIDEEVEAAGEPYLNVNKWMIVLQLLQQTFLSKNCWERDS